MRKYLAILCATMLCVCCLALAACGGGSSSGSASASASAASASASASASSSAVEKPATFVGDWNLAGAETQGLTIGGDLSQVLNLGGAEGSATLNIKDDGTAKMTLGSDTVDITWTQNDSDSITMTIANGSEARTVNAKLEDNALKMEMNDDSFTGNLIFTADGKYAGAKDISADKATPITSDKDLIGTWRLSGVAMLGMTMYGDADALKSMMGDSVSTDTTITFKEDGTVNFMGETAAWSVSSDGAAITMSGMSIPVKALDGDILLDASSLLGGYMNITMVFSK